MELFFKALMLVQIGLAGCVIYCLCMAYKYGNEAVKHAKEAAMYRKMAAEYERIARGETL